MSEIVSREERGALKAHGLVGLFVVIVAEILMFLKVQTISTLFTPIVWSGYILFVDSVVFKLKNNSLICSRTSEFLFMLPLSITFWLIFEFYNLFIDNWNYVNLPRNLWLRYLGYAWAFATIWPAILETEELIEASGLFRKAVVREREISHRTLYLSMAFGLICLVVPIIYRSRYLAAPVWLGFVFLLDPINYFCGGKSLFRDLEKGQLDVLCSLFLSGLACGFLWEFWNYWAFTKWKYTVPILEEVRIFEMPVVGYLGFLPFAAECYVMYNSVILLRLKRQWQLNAKTP